MLFRSHPPPFLTSLTTAKHTLCLLPAATSNGLRCADGCGLLVSARVAHRPLHATDADAACSSSTTKLPDCWGLSSAVAISRRRRKRDLASAAASTRPVSSTQRACFHRAPQLTASQALCPAHLPRCRCFPPLEAEVRVCLRPRRETGSRPSDDAKLRVRATT